MLVYRVKISRGQPLFTFLAEQRYLWFSQIVQRSYGQLNLHPGDLYLRLAHRFDVQNKNDFLKELSLTTAEQNTVSIFPDIQEAENELLEMEFRNAIILTMLLAAPIIFTLTIILYLESQPIMGLLLIVLMLLSDLITYKMRHPYRIQGWTSRLIEFKKNRSIIQSTGLNSSFLLNNLFLNPHNIELGFSNLIKNPSPASNIFFLLHSIILNSDKYIQDIILDEFFFQTKNIPQIELINEKKWQTLKSQFFFFTIVVIFFDTVFFAILFIIGKLLRYYSATGISELFPSFGMDPFQIVISFVFLISLLILLSEIYLDTASRLKFIVIWAIEGLSLYLLISGLFEFIIF